MGHVGPVVAVTGLRREGAVLRGLGVEVIAGGGDGDRLAAELARVAGSAAGLVSFGMAGALDPTLRLGDWVIGERLVGSCEAGCDPRWVAALRGLLPAAQIGIVHADGQMIASPEEKRSLRARYDATAVDMESHVVARAAMRAGVPFAMLRCISDEADTALPPAIVVAMRPGGGLDLAAVLRSILRQPGQVLALIQTIAGFRRAYAGLELGARAAGARLGFDLR